MKLTHPLVILDLETTGTWIEKDRIIEIGMIKCRGGGEVRETYVRRVNPGIPIPAVVTSITGIRDADVRNEPSFADLAREVLAFIGDSDFAGFNVERFDLPLLEREVFDAGLRLEWRHRTVYDCQKIYHIHEKRDLKAAYKFYCQKELQNAHSALGDTEAALEILSAQIAKYGGGNEYVESLIDFDYEPSTDFYDGDRKFRWWNGELYPVFGKYGRKHCVRELVEKDRAYLEWLITTDFDESVKTMLREALCGKFPAQGR
ncbi:MAG TPA: 3'-5' exonuclease [Candidatus Eisenbacteria bacterium]|nr:3'-5' exonuclease [Candidatus Eisenbacteria bacterium]